jgi:subtilisin family serine protease
MKVRCLILIIALTSLLPLTRAESSGGQEYIVVLKDKNAVTAVNRNNGTRTVRQVPNTSIFLLKAEGTEVDGDVLKKLKRDKDIDIVEKNGRVKLAPATEAPLSTSLVQQMTSLLDGRTLTTFYGTTVLKSYVDQPAVRITELNEARKLSTGAATRVAYIDTGVDFSHPALAPWLDPGVDLLFNRSASELDGLSQQMASLLDQQMTSLLDKRFLFVLNQAMASLLDSGNESAGFPSELGHGTLVAGVIHLFAPEARIVPIRAFDVYGNTTMFQIVEGIYRSIALDVDVINMSFSIDEDSDVLHKAMSDAQGNGIALVASVGNNARDSKNSYPAAYSQVIGVAATDFNDRIASFSNYGRAVSVVAPGAYVVSTVPGGKYAAAWGTSFSAPIISGTVALLASGRGHGQSDSSLAVTTADFIDDLNPGFEKRLGKGRVNVQRALKVKN